MTQKAWMIISVVLFGLLLISVGMNLTNTGDKPESLDMVTAKVVDFIEDNVDGEIDLVSSAESNGLYRISMQVDGQPIESYASIDGDLFFPTVVELDTQAQRPPVAENTAPTNNPISIDDDAIKGNKDAPVTIVEFSDYECSYCARFYKNTLSQLEEEYIDTGKVRFVYRDFPLTSIHPNAMEAAQAAECAGEQGRYYDMHDLLFEDGLNGGNSQYKDYARQLDLDLDSFAECLDSESMKSEVLADLQDGQKAGVTGTPAFFINGKLISGAQPIEAFRQIIDDELGMA